MRVLTIDTAGPRCAVGLFDVAATARTLATRSEPMARGHAEALLPMVEAVMAEAGADWPRLDRIAVVSGPGSFTGVRIGIAAARGLALAAGCPAVGISAFAARAAGILARPLAVMLDARRGEVCAQVFFDGAPPAPPAVLAVSAAPEILPPPVSSLAGSGAPAVASAGRAVGRTFRVLCDAGDIDLAATAILAAGADPARSPATPLYLRPPDAKPQTGARIARR